MALTCSDDGSVKVWDYCRKKVFFEKRFAGKSLTIDVMRKSDLNKGRICAVGFDTGLVRIL
jgi:WD40 repeat protein